MPELLNGAIERAYIPSAILIDKSYHYLHHSKFECNYGSPTTAFIDQYMGTFREKMGESRRQAWAAAANTSGTGLLCHQLRWQLDQQPPRGSSCVGNTIEQSLATRQQPLAMHADNEQDAKSCH